MKIKIQNPIFKKALSACLTAYQIDFTEKNGYLKTKLKMEDVKTHTLDTIDENTGLFLKDMHLMLYFLHEQDHTILYFSLDDIVMINGQYFFINPDKIIKYEASTITIEYPVQTDEFAPPELQQLEELPFSIPIESCYYSLAALMFYFITHKSYKRITDLDFLYYSPLYYCLKRMLYKNPHERKFLYI